jgi:acetyl esterase/lipase
MIKFFILSYLILFVNEFCFGQDITLPLWSGNIPNYRETDELEIHDTADILRIRYVQKPDISVYLPSGKNANGQAVIICPGGGYVSLSYDWEGTDIAKMFNEQGIAAIVLKYRLPVSKSNKIRHESPMLDAKRAIRLTRFHASEWNIKQDKIGIMGFSAGGHLAATLGTHFEVSGIKTNDPIESVSSRPDFMILIYPVITFSHYFMHKGSRDALLGVSPDSTLIVYYSNELHVKKNTPPTFIVHASDDKSVPVENSLLFYKALKNKGVSAEMHIYPQGGHGFSLALGKSYLQTWPQRCLDWLKWLQDNVGY